MKKYLRYADIAENLGVDKSTIVRWIEAGKFPKPFRPTKRTALFDAESVQEALDAMAAEAEA